MRRDRDRLTARIQSHRDQTTSTSLRRVLFRKGREVGSSSVCKSLSSALEQYPATKRMVARRRHSSRQVQATRVRDKSAHCSCSPYFVVRAFAVALMIASEVIVALLVVSTPFTLCLSMIL